MAIIFPYPEKDSSSREVHYYDSIAVINSDGSLLQNYRKTHLFGQAVKSNFSFGYTEINKEKLFPVLKIVGFPIGILNCYEAEFPELSRRWETYSNVLSRCYKKHYSFECLY